ETRHREVGAGKSCMHHPVVGKAPIAFNTNHPVAELPVVTAVGTPPSSEHIECGRIVESKSISEKIGGTTDGSRFKAGRSPITMNPATSHADPQIEARPVEGGGGREGRWGIGSIEIGRKSRERQCGESKRSDGQGTCRFHRPHPPFGTS